MRRAWVVDLSNAATYICYIDCSPLNYMLSLIFFEVCGSEMNSTLKSPGYPNNYPNNMDCVYLVPIPRGTTMNISFQDFDIEDNKVCR